jgi:hypothetical protein
MRDLMKLKSLLLMVAAAGFLTACGEEDGACTEDLAVEKLNEVTARMETMTDASPEDMLKILGQLQEVQTMIGSPETREGACAKIDEILAGLPQG